MARRGRLLAVLGVAFGVAVSVGNTIGAGILRTPGAIAHQLPSFWLFGGVWIAGGIYALLGANAIAELATIVPRSGGQYVFVRRALGDYPGFIVGWSDWISVCGTTAVVSIVIGEYSVALVPTLGSERAVALAALALFTLIQAIGVKAGSAAQGLTSGIKAFVLLLFVAACFAFGSRSPLGDSGAGPASSFVSIIVALQAVIYTYDGWNAPIYFSEEIREGGRNIPRSIFAGLFSVIAIYLLLIVAFLAVTPLASLAGSDLAAGVVAGELFGTGGATILRTMMVLALLSALSSNVLMAPRVVFALASDGLFWRRASEVTASGTPFAGLVTSSLLAAFFIVTGTFETVIAKLAFFFVMNYTLSFVSLFVLRWKEPDVDRPYRAWGHPFTTLAALIASVVFLGGAVVSDMQNSTDAMLILLISVPSYLMIRRLSQ